MFLQYLAFHDGPQADSCGRCHAAAGEHSGVLAISSVGDGVGYFESKNDTTGGNTNYHGPVACVALEHAL